MSVRAESPALASGTAATAGLARVRRASLVALVLIVVCFAANSWRARPARVAADRPRQA
jgi:hypothetical protein